MKGESITLKQDLIDWLNNKNNITPNTEGLLLAPINNKNENFESEITPVIQNENITNENISQEINPEIPATQNENVSQEINSEIQIESQEKKLEIEIPQDPPQELWTQIEDENIPEENNFDIEGFNLENLENLENLKEYIAKLKNQSDNENINDDSYTQQEELDLKEQLEISQYERGTHFTQKLKHVLKKRQDNAEKLRLYNLQNKKTSKKKILVLILTVILIFEIIFSTAAVLWLETKTPDYILNQATNFFESENYDEAFKTYESGFKLYPDITEFSDGLKQSAFKAGNFEIKSQDNFSHEIVSNEIVSDEIIINNEISQDNFSQDKIFHEDSFDELLKNGSNFLNTKSYENAIINFFKAYELNSSDVRPYLGLAASYKAKRQFFDSWRILILARKIFGNLPTIETAIKFFQD